MDSASSNSGGGGGGGVASFLRHFAPRRDDSSIASPGRRRYAPLSKRVATSTTRRTFSNHAAATPKPSLHLRTTDLTSPTSVMALPLATTNSKGTGAASTRLGISPTGYDISDSLPSPFLISPKTEEEVVVFESEAESQYFPTLFDSLSVWEEATKLEVENVEPPSSPQKSVANNSCGSDYSNRSGNGSVRSMRSGTGLRLFGGSRKSTDSMESTKRKAKEIVSRSRDNHNGSGSGSHMSSSHSGVWRRSLSPATTKSHDSSSTVGTDMSSSSSRVKIFLLLLEPTTKVFELIQLVYPRKTTKVGDLLQMIPKDATEPALANQTYIGITRPKRRSEPVMDLTLWASNNVLSTTDQTAGIAHGEVIVAIPAHASASHIVSLAKQILASGHIQTLISKSNSSNSYSGGGGSNSTRSRNSSASPQRSQDGSKSSRISRARSPTRSAKKDMPANKSTSPRRSSTNIHTPAPLTTDAIGASDSISSPRRSKDRRKSSKSSLDNGSTGSASSSTQSCTSHHTGTSQDSTTPVSPDVAIALKPSNRFQTLLANQSVPSGERAAPKLDDAFYYGYGGATAVMTKPSPSPGLPGKAPFLSENIFKYTSQVEERQHEVEFSEDMLNAYLSKEAVKNFCEMGSDEFQVPATIDRMPTTVTTDDMSLDDGSLTSSFQHWSQSLREDTMWLEGADHGTAGVSFFGKKHFTKQWAMLLFRLGLCALAASIARYYVDPAGMTGMQSRQSVLDLPFGIVGCLQFVFCFLVIVKFQRVMQGPVAGRPTKCPMMLLLAHMYESRYVRPAAVAASAPTSTF